jgi:NAD+ diphosphatase
MTATTPLTQEECWFIFQNDQLLIAQENNEKKLLIKNHVEQLQQSLIRRFSLSIHNQRLIYSAELRPDIALPDNLIRVPFKQALEIIGMEWYSIATRAFSIINWDKNHHYCGRCGNQTEKVAHAFERVCSMCRLSFFPRISPSIIVRINRGDELLLARSPHFNPGVYALIAGFVEAGETLEQAVARETHEEIGIYLKEVRYVGSQPWPFPDSLMIAFTAEYASGELKINYDEIEDAGWYRYDRLPGRPSSSISIANQLINQFISEQSKSGLNKQEMK